MRLWTVQTIEVYNQVMSAEGYSVNPKHSNYCGSDDLFTEPYAWLHDKAMERGFVDNGRGIIWAWYRRGVVRRKPDIRTLRKENVIGEKLCCITLEVPDDKVLLIDTNQWGLRLNNMACVTAEEEAMSEEEFAKRREELYAMPEADQLRYNESTWELVFDTSRATSIEAVFFGLDRSMVKGVQFFTGERDPKW